jgi:aminoglycoside 6'-N-acetyltransferase
VGLRVSGQLTVVREATEEDAGLLVGWHADPDVARFWDDETFTRDQMLERLRRPDVDAFVVEADGVPVGFLQAWHERGDREGGDAEGGIDMFLVPGARGRGLGPDAARVLARHLRDERRWRRVTVDPYLWNEAAIRAWRRAGFREVGVRDPDEEHTAPWLLMEWSADTLS